ncbi:LysR family transcriptional regulator [Geodermatophilus maliterrae]|uniref:LysR family transcriptional regulator n=1 Tax=Geodermatophilus maliterrae TaxID=3162531 RepID=A0ABV3XBX8_9ACTN
MRRDTHGRGGRSTVSQQIGHLERQAGTRLHTRVGRNVCLTPAAHVLFDHVLFDHARAVLPTSSWRLPVQPPAVHQVRRVTPGA